MHNNTAHRPARRATRSWAAAVTLVLAGAFAIGGMAPAQAAVQNRTLNHDLSGEGVPIPIFDTGLLVCDECIPDVFIADFDEGGAGLHISSDITTKWTSKAKTDLTYTDTLLRQGSTLDLSDHLTTSDGKLKATFNVHGFLGIVVRDPDLGDNEWHETTTAIDIDVAKSFDVACDLPAPGAPPASCQTVDQAKLTVIEYPILPGLVDLAVELRAFLQADVTSDGVVTVRKAAVTAGNPISPDRTMTFAPTDDTQADPMFIGCDQPVGNDLSYSFTGTHADASLALGVPLSVWFGAQIQDPIQDVGVDVPITTIPLGDTTLTLNAADATANLGSVLVDNVPPKAVTPAEYAGDEGTPVVFDGSGSSDNCGFPVLRWDFSDGGVAFGAHPHHTFADNGVYSGLLTATDAAGNHASTTFSVTIGNVKPVPDAGPDGSGAWGRDLTFNGFGTDPGAGDQSTLTYRWDFGDGSMSPVVTSASGGYSVQHAYSTPGTYTATLRVCDKNGACDTDTRDVVVRKRPVDVSQLGDTAGTYDTAGNLTASVTDEFGSPVQGRAVAFSVDGAAVGSSNTSTLGRATVAWTPLNDAGAHTSSADFAGDALYEPGSSDNGVQVSKKATSVSYTGTLTGGPNKTVVLSAVLKDATGKALGNRSIDFALGSQSGTATTDASGVATMSLKLSQKNGTYPLTATWSPDATDTLHYVGSSASATFKLQAK